MIENSQDFVIENGVLTKYTGPGGDVVIPEGVTKIGDGAFADCTSLQSVTIPEGVAEIGNWAFWFCIGLQSVVIPRSVKEIHRSVFAIHRPVLIAPHIPVANLWTGDKPGACVGFARLYLENAELDEKIKAGYFNYIKKKRKRLYSCAIRHEELLQVMLAEKLVFRKDVDPLLEECDKQNNIAAKAAVLDYAGKHLKPVDPLKEFKLKDL